VSDADPRPFRYRIDVREDHVLVWQSGLLTVEVARQMQRDILEAMVEADVHKAIFDNRDTDRPDEMVRAVMWSWVSECTQIERLAMVLSTDRNVRRARDTADRNRVSSEAFVSEADAIAWLRA
jgi:hypothetical protein